MSYIERNLLKNETINYRTKKHWVIFLFPLIFTLIGIILSSQKDLLVLLGYLSLFAALYFWLNSISVYLTSEFAVTNKRVLIKIGFIQRQSWETLLSKIASLEVKQTIFGRMLGYGTLIVQSTGGTKDAFAVISKPLPFRRHIQEQMELMQVNLSSKQFDSEMDTIENSATAKDDTDMKTQSRERL